MNLPLKIRPKIEAEKRPKNGLTHFLGTEEKKNKKTTLARIQKFPLQ